jgi:hypothetical protein
MKRYIIIQSSCSGSWYRIYDLWTGKQYGDEGEVTTFRYKTLNTFTKRDAKRIAKAWNKRDRTPSAPPCVAGCW